MHRPILALIASSVALAGSAPARQAGSGPAAAPTPDRTPPFGAFGFDTAGMDRSVRPGQDFDRFANGGWTARTPIPADRASIGMYQLLQDRSLERTRGILEQAAQRPGSKIGDFYASFMDQPAINRRGITPIQPWLRAIRTATDRGALASTMAKLQRMGVGGLFRLQVLQDREAPDRYVVMLAQSGLGLPDRDYYLADDPKMAAIRTQYQTFLAQILTLSGETNAAARASAVFAFEAGLARTHWTRVQSRDVIKAYNRRTPGRFASDAPGLDWTVYLKALGVAARPSYIVVQPSALTGESKLFATTPLDVLKDYMTLRLLRAYAPYLSQPFEHAAFAFGDTVLDGTQQQRPRWERAVDLVSTTMGEAIGPSYVERYFPPAAKAAADAMVANIVAAMDARIDTLTWMPPDAKVRAHQKLAAFRPKIGYPPRWRDYAALRLTRDDLVGNVARAKAFDYQHDLDKLDHPIDRAEWLMAPMAVNAYANPVMNEVVFPAAILQPPFFDPGADPAVNYGGIGAIIGHEISHDLNDQAPEHDTAGQSSAQWSPGRDPKYLALARALIDQYDAYEPLPGVHVQGLSTLAENIGDLTGLTIAYDAYHRSLGGKPAAVIDGFTGDQRFFLGWAQVWRSKVREPALRSQLLSDAHAPGAQRIDEVRNLQAWYDAFGVKPGDTLYLAPGDRVRIW